VRRPLPNGDVLLRINTRCISPGSIRDEPQVITDNSTVKAVPRSEERVRRGSCVLLDIAFGHCGRNCRVGYGQGVALLLQGALVNHARSGASRSVACVPITLSARGFSGVPESLAQRPHRALAAQTGETSAAQRQLDMELPARLLGVAFPSA